MAVTYLPEMDFMGIKVPICRPFFSSNISVDNKEDAAFLDVAELVVYRGPKHSHGWRQAHICVDQRRDVVSVVADGFVENFIVILECVVDEELAHCLVVHMCGKRVMGHTRRSGSGKCFVRKYRIMLRQSAL